MRHLRKLLLVSAIIVALVVPATASAKVDDSYRGWGTVTASSGNTWAPAWSWYSYYGWWGTYRSSGDRVWIQPFATGWSWTWNGGGGWMAMRTRDLAATTARTGISGTVRVTTCGGAPRPDGASTCNTHTAGAGTNVTIQQGDMLIPATTGADGTFFVAVPSGRYTVFVSGPFGGGIGGASKDVVVTAGATTSVTLDQRIDAP